MDEERERFFCDLLRACREAKGMTQGELAARCVSPKHPNGIAQSTVQGSEAGRYPISEKTLAMYARGLGYPDLRAFLVEGLKLTAR